MPRSFVSLPIGEVARQAVAEEIERLRPLSRAVAWVPASNIHLTLRFLGDQSPERLEQAMEALGEAASRVAPFSLALHGLGAFPGLERPRILWIGVAEGAAAVRALQARVEASLDARGFGREERPWHPHLTIGRVFDDRRWRREVSPELRAAIAGAATRSLGAVAVSAISLMRSDLSPRGARHSELASFGLTDVPHLDPLG